jgi:hypothetical protein
MQITPSAESHIVHLLQAVDAPDDIAIRFHNTTTGWAIRVDAVQPNDRCVQHGTRTIVAIDPRAMAELEGRILDVELTDEGPRLAVC